MGEDLDLSYHYDNAEVTLNVSLGKEFIGGELFFGDMRQVSFEFELHHLCVTETRHLHTKKLAYSAGVLLRRVNITRVRFFIRLAMFE